MSLPRKFAPGRQIADIHDLIHCISLGCWVYWPTSDRPKHPSIILSMQLNTLMSACRSGRIRIAVQNAEEIAT